MNDNYLKGILIDVFNMILNNSIVKEGNKPLEHDLISDMISFQFQAENKTILLQTESFNYVLSEADGQLRLCEFKNNKGGAY